ncbi:hypothetical protein ACFMBG_14845 [Leisingera sp. D0M16]|uniref:hypothetical protein n=1 Tax=Leisingera coralii TaxID=3351347 RepID=UPI003B825BC1
MTKIVGFVTGKPGEGMKNSKMLVIAAAVALLQAGGTSPALALTAGDVLDKMNADQRYGFISGAVDMASQLYAEGGNREKGECALSWFFDGDDGIRMIHDFFDAHKDKDAVGLLSILINRQCGT